MRRDREMHAPPFRTLTDVGLRVPTQNLSPLHQIVMAFAFPAFLGRAAIQDGPVEEPDIVQELRRRGLLDARMEEKIAMRKTLRRRFSGDRAQSISRERYFALGENCLDTILGELNNYAVPNKTGYCAAVPGSDSRSIEVRFRGLPGDPNPLWKLLNEPESFDRVFAHVERDPRDMITAEVVAQVPNDMEWSMEFACELVPLEIPDVLDLRYEEARRWVLNFFHNPPVAVTAEDLNHGDFMRALAEGYHFPLESVRQWKDLLPVFNYNGFGGNGMTDLFAIFLRKLGCGGLVYGSTRSDHTAIFDEGEMFSNWGWNLVNYSGAPIPSRISTEDYAPLETRGMPHFYGHIPTGRHQGSLLCVGYTRCNRIVHDDQLEMYVRDESSAWRARHPGSELRFKGGAWFERTYNGNGLANPMIHCAYCRTPLELMRALPRSSCPSCSMDCEIGVEPLLPIFFKGVLETIIL